MVLAVVAMSSTWTPSHSQAKDGAGSGHAVVRVTAHDAGVQPGRPDHQAIAGLLGVAAQAVDLGDQGCQPVRLVPAEVRNPGEPGRAVCQGAECGDCGGQLAGVREIGTPDFRSGGDGEDAVAQADIGAHFGQDAAPEIPYLLCLFRPAGNPDGSAGGQGCGQEWPCVGQVLLDPLVEGADGPRGNYPVVRGLNHQPQRRRRAGRQLSY
jgi:hypothetical protein